MKITDFLIVLQTEELPAGYIEPALNQLTQKFSQLLVENRISYKEIKGFGVPKILTVLIKEGVISQKPSQIEVLGPSKKVAFDEKGRPTQQAIGFAKRNKVSLKDLKIKSTPKGEYVCCSKNLDSKSSKFILRNSVLDIIKLIKLPKTMRWDDSKVLFARPIREISVLEGDRVSAYFKKTKSIIDLDPVIRKQKIISSLKSAARRIGARVYLDEALVDEVTNMVERPFVFLGRFNKEYCLLPKEVLIASMSKYQRLFAVTKENKLLPNFIAVINGGKKTISKIKSNYEGVLDARLKDSLFFFKEDLKETLFEKKERLKELIFHKDLGNMYEKIFRIKELALFLAKTISLESEKLPIIERAALLAKADLVTQMVKEFPSLQGSIGKEYALRNEEEQAVACAIREHYLPSVIEDPLPATEIGILLAIADRIDSLVGFLGVGLEATGSFDPYGIRRMSHAVIRLIVEKNIRISLNEILEKAIEVLKDKIKVGEERLKKTLPAFLRERIENLIDPENSAPPGLKEAVLCVGFDDLVDTFNRFKALLGICKTDRFLQAAKVVERTHNILKGAKEEIALVKGVDPGRFIETLEDNLWSLYLQNKDEISRLICEERYAEVTNLYGETFFKTIHKFFDKVLVNVEEESLRLNRLAIMKAINRLYTEKVADLAKLPQIVV